MISHRVTIKLFAPDETISGTLARVTPEGITVRLYGTLAPAPDRKFYPMHRVVNIDDYGYDNNF